MKPKIAYDKIGLQKILTDPAFRTVDAKGCVLPPSNAVYQTISNLMAENGSKITPKHVHTIINNNRNGFKDCILKSFNIQMDNDITTIDDGNYSVSLTSNQSTDADTSKNSFSINLVLSPQKWNSIQPVEKKYGSRMYWKLRAGWADVVAEAMWIQHQLDCVFVSKNNTVYQSPIAQYYLTFDGYCRECGAKIRGMLLKEPVKDIDVMLKVTFDGMKSKAHTGDKRRQLRGTRRQRVADSLINTRKDAITWRRKEAARLKQFGGKNPPILASSTVLRKAKEQRLVELYGLDFANPALNLLRNAEQSKYVASIHHVAILKFNCVYWSPEQLQIYTARCRNNPEAQFIIDATGGLAKRDQSHDPHIFLYQCVLVTKDGSVPVFQMVSADQRSLIVAYFLRLILAANAPIPPIVVTDFGWSLLIAIAEVFGRCASFSDYLKKCYNAVVNKAHSLPSTFMRLDVCHLAAMISRWECLKGNNKSLVRRFYKHCVGQAAKINNIEDLSFFIESVIVVALSKYIGCSNNAPLPSEERLRFINEKIKGASFPENEDNNMYAENEQEDGLNTEENPEKDNMGWKLWGEQIFKRARLIANASADGDTINACCNEEFAAKLKKHLIPYVPLWTGVMVPIFGRGASTATSAAVESEFGDLKHRDFKGELPMRVDRFVLQHLDRIDEKIKERSKETDVLPASSASLSTSETSFLLTVPKNGSSTPTKTTLTNLDANIPAQNEWSIQEEWGGLFKNKQEDSNRKQPKLSCFDDCPEWDFVKDAQASRIPVLMNGSTLGPVRMHGSNWNVTETCAFDAIFQILISGISTNIIYRGKLEQSESPLVQLANNIWSMKKVTKQHYIKRASILSQVYFLASSVTTFTKHVKRLVARCNAAHLAEVIFDKDPSIKIETNCIACGYSRETKSNALIDVNVDIILCGGFHQMQAAIEDCASTTRSCIKCANRVAASADYGPHLVIDTSVLTDPGYPSRDNITRHTLSSMSKRINVGGGTYLLTGVVGYIAEMSHYVAYALTGDIWYKYDDLVKKRTIAKGDTEIFPHLVIYGIHRSNEL